MLTILQTGCTQEILRMLLPLETVDESVPAKENVPDEITEPDETTEQEDLSDLNPEALKDEVSGLQTMESADRHPDQKHAKLTLADSGWDVFTPATGDHPDYRFNPSIMLQEDGGIDAWFSAPGDGYREYDYISYKHSDDGGHTWSEEKIVLCPTPNSPDALSVCDPDVFYYDGYYYIGYSSTINKKEKGLCNSLFLARSKQPDGPFEKWNGNGWGGLPAPFIYFDGVDIGWGCGEPSFVILDHTLYVYTTKDSFSPDPKRVRLTEVYSVRMNGELWPADVVYRGVAADRSDTEDGEEGYRYQDADCWDVAYVEDAEKFIAIGTNRRFLNNSCLVYYESTDGVHYERVSELNTNIIMRCHNCGIMSDASGHIKPGDPMIIGYAYSGSNHRAWGVWGTRFVNVALSWTDEIDLSDEGRENLSAPLNCAPGVGSTSPRMIKTDRLVYNATMGSEPLLIRQFLRDGYHGGHVVASEDVTYTVSDPAVATVEDGRIIPVGIGITSVTVAYEDVCREVAFCVADATRPSSDVTGFFPMTRVYQVPLHTPFITKVRPMAVYADCRIREMRGEEMLQIGLKFATDDPTICDIWQDGTLIPQSEGETFVHVTTETGPGYSVMVRII